MKRCLLNDEAPFGGKVGRFSPETTHTSSAAIPIAEVPSDGGCLKLWKKTPPQKDDLDSVVVRELNQLSLEEREVLYEDIHGVADQIDETDEFLKSKLEGMQTAINWIKKKKAYDQARFLNPAAVYDRELRLAMIRSSLYDEILAAKRLVKYFESKLELFGLDLLAHAITQDDLDPNMKTWLQCGCFQIMPQKDRAGRTIMVALRNNQDDQDWKGFYGMIWYLTMSVATRDVELQKKGFVCIIWQVGDSPHSGFRSRGSKLRDFEVSLPTRMAAYHCIYDDPRVRPLMSLVQLSTLTNHRLRFRSHFGSNMEGVYALMSYGITPSMLPIDESGKLDQVGLKRRLDYLRDRDRSEAAEVEKLGIITPKSNDCVLGRGYPFQKFVGNVFLSCVIQSNRDQYSQLKRNQKTAMAVAVVTFIRTVRGGRFLKRNTDDYKSSDATNEIMTSCWALAGDDEARTKVAQVFRTVVQNDLPDLSPYVPYTLPTGVTLNVPKSCLPESQGD